MQGTLEPSREDFTPVSYDSFEKVPNVPSGWPLEAQAIWRDVGTLLKNSGYMSKGFVYCMRAFCWSAYRREVAEQRLIDNPLDTQWEKVLHENTKVVERISTKFGFTPADLYRVPAIKKAEGKTMNLLK